MKEQEWQQHSLEILTDITAWRQEHPQATFVEIEAVIHERMMQLEAQLLQETAQASPSRQWGEGTEHPAPRCPDCGEPLQARGKQKRTLQGNGGVEVSLERTYGTCPKCGQGFFPPR